MLTESEINEYVDLMYTADTPEDFDKMLRALLAKDREWREVVVMNQKEIIERAREIAGNMVNYEDPLQIKWIAERLLQLLVDGNKTFKADLAARLEERKKAHENNLPDESDAANSFVLGMIDGLGEAVYEVKK